MLIIKSKISRLYIDTNTERDFHEEVAHVILEAEKAHNLLSTSRRPSCWCRFSPENQGANGISPDSSLKPQESGASMYNERKDGCPSSSRDQTCPYSDFLFYSGLQNMGWCPPILTGWFSSFPLQIQMLIFFRNILPDTALKSVLPAIWAAHTSAKLTHKIKHHSGEIRKWSMWI